ncbi:unnamed protein product [Lampetra fluviatilis]
MAIFAHVLLILVCVATLFLVTCSFSYLVTWRRRKSTLASFDNEAFDREDGIVAAKLQVR